MKADVVQATLLADPTRKITAESEGSQTKITLPSTAPDPIASVIRLDLRAAPDMTTI
jgi:hypothetical protein